MENLPRCVPKLRGCESQHCHPGRDYLHCDEPQKGVTDDGENGTKEEYGTTLDAPEEDGGEEGAGNPDQGRQEG